MFGNKLMTALFTLNTMADQQSAWGSSLNVVLVDVQHMKTVLVAAQQSLLESVLPSVPLRLPLPIYYFRPVTPCF